jgi:hypothetical protein
LKGFGGYYEKVKTKERVNKWLIVNKEGGKEPVLSRVNRG